jgi:hypothetical protein
MEDLNMDTEDEIFFEKYAEVFARKAVAGFRQATQRCDGDWVGEVFDSCDLVAMTGFFDDNDGMVDVVCDIIDGWGGPWVRVEEQPDPL